MNQTNARLRRFCLCFCAVLTAVLLWRWQRIFYLMCADYIRSDMPAHVQLALGHNDYGLSSYLIRFLWSLKGEHFGQTALSLVLTANQLFGIFTLWLLLRHWLPELDSAFALLAVLLAHLCGPWIFPGQTEMYLGVYNGNVYHNMTVLFSRSFIPLDLLLFARLWEGRRGKLPVKIWLGFALSLLVTTLFKPSFFVAFAPVALALLVWDFVKTRARGFGSELLLGCAFFPAAGALLWSYVALFAGEFAGTESHMVLRRLTLPWLGWTLLMYLRGLLLPLYSFCTQGRREREKRERFGIFAAVNAVAIAEAIFLTETGFRANDGNFDWGCLSLYTAVFALSIGLLFRMGQQTQKGDARQRLRLIVGLVLLLGHLVIGVYCLSRPGRAGYDWFYF